MKRKKTPPPWGQGQKWLALGLLLMTYPGFCWKCDVSNTVCEVWLEVEHRLTMMKGKTLVVAKHGVLFPYDAANFSALNSIAKEHVISGDGWAEPRLVMAVNGSVPGPLLEVHEGQTVRVHVTNRMMSEATSLHFHGQHQKGTPWMDGVSFVSQCPVLPGQTFTHQFLADPAGTHWYHSHTGSQLSMGVLGGFVVHPRQGSNPRYHRQFTLLVMDYNHDWDSTMDFMKMQWGMYVKGRKESGQRNLSGARYSMFRCQTLLINGRGRYRDPDTNVTTAAPLEMFTVRHGGIYRFRVVHAGSVYPFRLSVDGHRLRVVATDGMDLQQPLEAEAVILTPGERYDFELSADRSMGNYWMRAVTLELGAEHTAEAILHYDGAPAGTVPTSRPRDCTASEPCTVVNCPFLYYPVADYTRCINVEQLRSAEPMPPEVANSDRVKEFFLNFAFPGTTFTPASINGISMVMPRVSALTQPLEVDNRCPGDGYRCEEDQLCSCANVLNVAQGDVIQFVALNLGKGKGWDHPVHLHGHHFWVLKVGYPVYNSTTGVIVGDNLDIDCQGDPDRDQSFCNRARWAHASWSGNTVPGLQLQQPVLKDTVNVPTGGYVILRLRADNPGLWPLHCHVALHMEDGMVMLLNESFMQQPPPPPGMPRCGSFSVPYPDNHAQVSSTTRTPPPGGVDSSQQTVGSHDGPTRSPVSVAMSDEDVQMLIAAAEAVAVAAETHKRRNGPR